MLIELDGGGPHEEDTWVGGRIALGETILRSRAGRPRCAITTHDPDTGVRDLDTLQPSSTTAACVDGKDADFGVLWGGRRSLARIRLGDEVTSGAQLG